MSRRQVLQGLSVGAAAVMAGHLVASGGDAAAAPDGDATRAIKSPADAAPTRGGTLRVAELGASTDTLDPTLATTRVQFTILGNVLDQLVRPSPAGPELVAAESIEPNVDGTVWTVRLHEGMIFHDGRPVTSNDVVFSILQWANSDLYGRFFADLDAANVRAVDERTLEMPLLRPRGDWVDSTLTQVSYVVPADTVDFARGLVGSGPFKLDSFQPGQSAALVANADYWRDTPYVEDVELQVINDAGARLNGLKAGQIDFASGLLAETVRTEAGNDSIRILVGDATNSVAYSFIMNNQVAPFDDPDVREAFRLAVDRQMLVDTVLLGAGEIGNDMIGSGFPGYPESVPQREHDPDEAQRLLAAAGVTEVVIRAGDYQPNLVNSAEVFAQQLAEVGVNATIDEIPGQSYFDDFAAVSAAPIQAFATENEPGLLQLAATTGANATLPLGGQLSPEYNALLERTQATVDDAERRELLGQVQQMLREEGGFMYWGFGGEVNGARQGVHDVTSVSNSTLLLGRAWIE